MSISGELAKNGVPELAGVTDPKYQGHLLLHNVSKEEYVRSTGKSLRSGLSNSFSLGATAAPVVAFKGPKVLLGLYTCNYSFNS